MSQTPRTVAVPMPAVAPPPLIDPNYSSFDGVGGMIETAAVLTISSAAAWVGIRTGLSKQSKTVRIAGWIGGVGSVLIGLLYLGGKSGLGSQVGLPAVRVTPS
jgi:hypothetical protein